MPLFNVYLTITAGGYGGQIEAPDAETAQRLAEDEHLESPRPLCHQCSRVIDEPTVQAVSVEPA